MLVGMDHTANIPEAVPKASSDPLPEISSFLEPFAPLFRRSQSRHSLERYITGLLTDLDRKNCDTIAAALAGTSTERLQHLLTAAEGWLIGERPLPGELSSAKNKEGEEELKYYYSTLGAEVSLERMASLAKSRWAIGQFYEDGKGECGLGDFQGRRWDGLHRHLALSMVAYSFLMLYSSVTRGEDPTSQEAFFPLG